MRLGPTSVQDPSVGPAITTTSTEVPLSPPVGREVESYRGGREDDDERLSLELSPRKSHFESMIPVR